MARYSEIPRDLARPSFVNRMDSEIAYLASVCLCMYLQDIDMSIPQGRVHEDCEVTSKRNVKFS